MTTQAIGDMIANAMLLDLQDAFANLPEEETPGLIKVGRLQEDPETLRLALTIELGDSDDPEWRDTAYFVKENSLDPISFRAFSSEVGGGELWWKRGTLRMYYFATQSKEEQDVARNIATVTFGRAKRAISLSTRINAASLTDDFGEQAIKPLVVKEQLSEGGGPPDSYIWRGKVYWQVLTGRNL